MAKRTENGRPCGCDPGADHVCEQHANARDLTRRTIEGAWSAADGGRDTAIVVTGPDADGEFGIQTGGPEGDTLYLNRWAAEDLVDELKRRLSLRT